MKLYTKEIDGSRVIKTSNRIIVYTNGMQIINPPHEMLIDDGWEEYVAPEIIEVPKTLDKIREEKINEILQHDSSDNVNLFYVGEYPMWLDKATRVGLKLRFEAELENAMTETTLWYNGIPFQLNLDVAMKMLHAIELYASACYDVTQRHLYMIEKFNSIEELEAYDYTKGYPEKLRF